MGTSRVEDHAYPEIPDHRDQASNVVVMRMSEHQDVYAIDSLTPKKGFDDPQADRVPIGLLRFPASAVNEDSSTTRSADEYTISLSHIQEHGAKCLALIPEYPAPDPRGDDDQANYREPFFTSAQFFDAHIPELPAERDSRRR